MHGLFKWSGAFILSCPVPLRVLQCLGSDMCRDLLLIGSTLSLACYIAAGGRMAGGNMTMHTARS